MIIDLELHEANGHKTTTKKTDRVWASALIDAASRRVLAIVFSFASPSQKTCMTEELERLVSPMKSATVEEINGFLEKYGSGNFPHANELLPLLRAEVLGAETLEDDHYSLIMRGIKDRAKAGSPKAETVSFTLEMQDLVERVVQNRDEPCRLWRFKAAKGCFWVYEMVNSGTIAGCISDHPETP